MKTLYLLLIALLISCSISVEDVKESEDSKLELDKLPLSDNSCASTIPGTAVTKHNNLIYKMGGESRGCLWIDDLQATNNKVLVSENGIDFYTIDSEKLPGGRSRAGLVSFKGKLWYMGGIVRDYPSPYNTLNDIWSSTDGVNWKLEVRSAPWLERMEFGIAVHNNRIYIMGGCYYKIDGASHPPYLTIMNHMILGDTWSSDDGINWRLESTDPDLKDWGVPISYTPLYIQNENPQWAKDTDYTIGDYVKSYPFIYVCTENHLSGVTIDEDITKWERGDATTDEYGNVDGWMWSAPESQTTYDPGDLVTFYSQSDGKYWIFECTQWHVASFWYVYSVPDYGFYVDYSRGFWKAIKIDPYANTTKISLGYGFKRVGIASHQMVSYNGKLWITGGESMIFPENEKTLIDNNKEVLYEWFLNKSVWNSPDGITWTEVTKGNDTQGEFDSNGNPISTVTERVYHSMTVHDDKLWIAGGVVHDRTYSKAGGYQFRWGVYYMDDSAGEINSPWVLMNKDPKITPLQRMPAHAYGTMYSHNGKLIISPGYGVTLDYTPVDAYGDGGYWSWVISKDRWGNIHSINPTWWYDGVSFKSVLYSPVDDAELQFYIDNL